MPSKKQVEDPYITCDEHGRQLGTIVCIHIFRGGAPVHHESLPNETRLGEMLCKACCGKGDRITADQLRLACIKHAEDFRLNGRSQ